MCRSVLQLRPSVIHTMASTLAKFAAKQTFNLTRKTICGESVLSKRALVINCRFLGNRFQDGRKFSVDAVREGSAARAETTSTTQGLSKLQAQELVLRLTDEERSILINALQEYQSKVVKEEYEGQLAASRWRSKFGRPSKLPTLGDVDPTGSYCAVPEDWLKRKWAESVPRPSTRSLIDIAIANSIPFIGFGFLDNFFMLLFGDYIDVYLGSYLFLSTMAAAALGNTFSDVLGIGTAFYVERLACKIGFNPPKLSPIQMDMPISRNFANLGRVIGVTIGCLLGMCPLLFPKKTNKEAEVDAPE